MSQKSITFAAKIGEKSPKNSVIMVFNRNLYLQKLISADGNGMIKIITGIRRCGKSFLLFELFKNYLLEQGIQADHIIQINLEDRRNKRLRNPDMLLEYIDNQLKDQQKYYILLDEIQLVSEFEDVLNSYLHISNAEVYVTGSNARFLSKDVITELRGRGWEIRVRPLSFAEYFEGIGGDKRDALQEYYAYGGLPAVALLPSAEEKIAYLKEMYHTIYFRDIVERNRLQNEEGLEKTLQVLASSMGATINPTKIANTFKSVADLKISANTISKYIEHLKDAFMISEAMRYNIKGRKYIGADSKYYFEDPGIRNAILGFRQIENSHMMENVLYNELSLRGYSVDVGLVEIWEKGTDGKNKHKKLEVDYVINRGSQRIYIQSAYMMSDTDKISQEIRPLMKIDDSFRKVIISGDYGGRFYNNEGVLRIGIFDFLFDTTCLNE
jgi:predicted AAA+ superfamily ATPase